MTIFTLASRLLPRPLGAALLAATLAVAGAVAGCDAPGRGDLPAPPGADDVRPFYTYGGDFDVEIVGNVARVTFTVDPAPFERGGDLWAKGTPYLFLFSQGTKDALDTFPGLGGVRVVTVHPGGDVMAEALLVRGRLNDYTWRQALNVAGQARRDATTRPGRMRDLVEWGE
ncbi:MAG: hypothetical protein EA350_12635, partial [Gemmatimonadales bacterium]